MDHEPIRPVAKTGGSNSAKIQIRALWFACSAFAFRLGLALVTFEQVRPLGSPCYSDYCFCVSLLFCRSPGY